MLIWSSWRLTFLTRNRRQVENLQKGDLILYEDEVKQEISTFGQESTSLSIILLLDTSESLAPFIKQAESLNRSCPMFWNPGTR